ncbi:hypothetical protein D3C80_1552290 [compost metagenome]
MANLLVFHAVVLDVDRQVLARFEVDHLATVNRRQHEAANHLALWLFFDDAEGSSIAPATLGSFAGLINLAFALDKYIRQHPVGFTPGVQHFLPRAEHFVQGCQQMTTDNLILIRANIQAGMLLGNALHRWQQRRQVFDIRGIGADRVEQCLTLIAIALVVHIEHVL